MDPRSVEQLRAYQARSRQVQRWLLRGLLSGLAVAGILALAGVMGAALPVAAVAGIVAGCGFWITHGHIEEFEQQLRARARR